MTNIVYPGNLPLPKAIVLIPIDRRSMDNAARPHQAAALQRDRLSSENVTWPPFSEEEASQFYGWWRNTLIYGGSWFAAMWPSPQGISLVRRFNTTPVFEYVPGGLWSVSAEMEVRGVGLDPRTHVPLTWNPLRVDSGQPIYSDKNKTVSSGYVRSTFGTLPLSGKCYFEFVLNAFSIGDGGIGVGSNALDVLVNPAGQADQYFYLLGRGWYWSSAIADYLSGKPTFADGNRGMVAVDGPAGKLWFGKSGVWNEGDPALGTLPSISGFSGTLYPSAGMSGDFTSITIVPSESDWHYEKPVGFGAIHD